MNLALLDAATAEVERLLREVPAFAWDGPGLGEWNLRDLAGHVVRSVEVVVDYLGAPEPDTAAVPDAAAYFAAATADGMEAAVAARGRERATRFTSDDAIGDDYAGARKRALEAAGAADPDRLVVSALGPLPVHEYLRTRLLEAVVHGLDIARAIETEARFEPAAIRAVVVLLAEVLATDRERATRFVLSATGREPEGGILPVLG